MARNAPPAEIISLNARGDAMTLITYPMRVHFADSVLEEALHSELEKCRARSVLLIGDNMSTETEFVDRIKSGLPRGCQSYSLQIGQNLSPAGPSSTFRNELAKVKMNAIVSFGTARAIEAGRQIRRELRAPSNSAPTLFAIPGVDGLPDPNNDHTEGWRDGLPSVLIFDPTLILSASEDSTLRAYITCLARCIESYLSSAYNPPADGMALDGFSRSITNFMDTNARTDIEARRDLMAACLNAAMALEKGLGPAQLLSSALAKACRGVRHADVSRLILPGIVAATRHDARKTDTLSRVMGRSVERFDVALRNTLSRVPFGERLSGMGVTANHLETALKSISGRSDISYPAAAAVLENVY